MNGKRVAGRASIVGALAAPLVLLPVPPAVASSTGEIYERALTFNNGVAANVCDENVVELGSGGTVVGYDSPGVFNYGSPSCIGGFNVPTGYLVGWVELYRNGSLCNSASYQSPVAAQTTTAATDCANPSGSQTWTVDGYSGWFKGQYCTANDHCVNGFTITNVEQTNDIF